MKVLSNITRLNQFVSHMFMLGFDFAELSNNDDCKAPLTSLVCMDRDADCRASMSDYWQHAAFVYLSTDLWRHFISHSSCYRTVYRHNGDLFMLGCDFAELSNNDNCRAPLTSLVCIDRDADCRASVSDYWQRGAFAAVVRLYLYRVASLVWASDLLPLTRKRFVHLDTPSYRFFTAEPNSSPCGPLLLCACS